MISIATTYFNRKIQFTNTLNSLRLSKVKNFEVIAVDDGSEEDQRIEHLQKNFEFLKVIRIDKNQKWYHNPCIPFNIAFSKCSGDKIIIQNADCLHYSDILSRTEENLNDSNYLSFATYSLDKESSEKINQHENISDFINKFSINDNRFDFHGNGFNGWYNHGIYRQCGFHFCSAITKKNLTDLNGFDELYAHGICYDDNEFLYRIQLKELNIIFENEYIAIHQWHQNFNYNKEDKTNLENRNRQIFEKFSKRCLSYRANQ
jgi:glycosyltransferase involved in cell wall biosynthesis